MADRCDPNRFLKKGIDRRVEFSIFSVFSLSILVSGDSPGAFRPSEVGECLIFEN
jgi:hypothetical protein